MIALATIGAWAADNKWTGAVNSKWNESGNWSRNVVPNATDKDWVVFDSSTPATPTTVEFDDYYVNAGSVTVRNMGDATTPLVFKANNSACGAQLANGADCKIGNETGDAYLRIENGTWLIKGRSLSIGKNNSYKGELSLINGASLSIGWSLYFENAGNRLSVASSALISLARYFCLKAGEVKVENGTIEVNKGYAFEIGANSAARLLLNEGGLLITKQIAKKTYGGTVLFNGGTLRSNNDTATLIDDDNALTVMIGSLGGTIDTGAFNITVPAAINSEENMTGDFTVTGGGSATFPKMGNLVGAFAVGDNTTLHWFDQDGTANTYNLAGLTLGKGSKIFLNQGDSFGATPMTIAATEECKAEIEILFSSSPAAETSYELFPASTGDIAKLTVTPKIGSLTIPHEVSIKNGKLTLTITADTGKDYVWNGSQDNYNWGDTGAWTKNDAPADWSDGNNAIFSTANATANLAANAAASEVRFRANATVSGSATLTAGKVDVADGVLATISAPTAGSLEKTGAGTLMLGASRTAQTTVSAGTLAMANGATVDGSKLTFGTDAAKPVVFDYGGQQLAFDPASNIPARMDVSLTNGEFTKSGTTCIEDSTMRVAAGASFVGTGWICVGGKSSSDTSDSISANLVVDGGAVTNSAFHLGIGDYGSLGSCSKVLVTNGGEYYSANHIAVAQRSSGHLTVDDSKVTAVGELLFCNDERCEEGENGYVSVTNGGEIATTAVKYGSGAGNGYFDFDGGTLKARADGTLIYEHDRLFVSVNDEGGTIDNGGFSVTIAEDLLGTGAVTNKGAGSIAYSVNQTGTGEMVCEAGETFLNAGLTVARPTTVASGAKLTVNATSQATITINRLTLESGSTLNIASYAGTAAALSVSTLTLPDSDSGTVALKLNGGAFPVGTYKILDKADIAVEDVERKLVPLTGSEMGVYSIDGSTLVLTVGTPVHGRWRASAGSGNFSDPGNWEDGQVPVASDTLDFSGVTGNITINCGDLSGTSFAGVTLPKAKVQVTIKGTLRIASMTVENNKCNFSVDSDSKLIVDGDVTLSSASSDDSIRYIVYENNGEVEIVGKVKVTGSAKGYACYNCSESATIAVNGIECNNDSGDHMKLNADKKEAPMVKWIVGAGGLGGDGDKYYWIDRGDGDKKHGAGAELKAAASFSIERPIAARQVLTLDTADGKTITVNDAICMNPAGNTVNTLTVKGSGSVKICNVMTSSGQGEFTGDVVVTNTATLSINAGKRVTTGTIVVNSGATLQVAQSGTVKLGGDLTLKNGACLGFNYTTRNAPKLDLSGKTVTFEEGEEGAGMKLFVKISGKRPFAGENVLTCGGNFSEDVVLTLTEGEDAPDWVKSVYVNDAGDIAIDVKPMGTKITVR